MYRKISQEMTEFLKECPTAFHAVEKIRKELEDNGYERLRENENGKLSLAENILRRETIPVSSHLVSEKSLRITALILRRLTVILPRLR